MSGPGHTPTPGPSPVRLRCARCGAGVAPEQDWCLECGAPARTRLAPTPNWRLPIAFLAVIALVAGLALSIAFTSLTKDDGTVSATPTAPAQPNENVGPSVPAPSSAVPAP